MKKHLIVLLCCLLFSIANSLGQEFSNNDLVFSVGPGGSFNPITGGIGVNLGVGYQRDIWKNRLRIAPNFGFGAYFGRAEDASDSYFNSVNLTCNVDFDILKIKSFSLFIGTGLTVNYSVGFLEGGGERGVLSSGHFGSINLAFNGLAGIRIYPKTHRMGYELVVFNGSFGMAGTSKRNSLFVELILFQVRIIVRLK